MPNLYIINLQPADGSVSRAARALAAKPASVKGYVVAFHGQLEEIPINPAKIDPLPDKVYLVGHGGENTLGGRGAAMLAEELLARRATLWHAEKIVLVMCGTEAMTAAEIFAQYLKEGNILQEGYPGEICAYPDILTVWDGEDAYVGKKYIQRTGRTAPAGYWKKQL